MGNYNSSEAEHRVGEVIEQTKLLSTTDKRVKYADSLPTPIVKRDVKGVEGAFVLDNVLNDDECKQFIDMTEEMGYGDAPVTVGENLAQMNTDFRNNRRVMWDAPQEILIPLWNRVKEHMPQTLQFKYSSIQWHIKQECGLNERLRFYRYDKNQTFKPHFDGAFRRSNTEKSHLTFIIYLNDGFDGGQTTFFVEGQQYQVNPVRGSALVFFHTGELSPLHEGSPHRTNDARKYVLRSDIMYEYTLETEEEERSIDLSRQGRDRDTQETDVE